MKHQSLALCLTLLGSPLAIDAAETNSLASLVRQADLVAHVQVTGVERSAIMTAGLTFRCSATCVVKETLKGPSRRGRICVYFSTRLHSDPAFETGKDYITFLEGTGTNQLGQESFALSYPSEDAPVKDVRPYSPALWDEIRTNALPRSSHGRSDPRGATNAGGKLEFRDHTGKIVATGKLQLPDPLPAHGQAFVGRWQLISAKASFPTNSIQSGTFRGFVNERGLSINLNPNDADNNVELTSSRTNGSLSGTWSLSTIAGAKNMGSFTVTHPYGDAR